MPRDVALILLSAVFILAVAGDPWATMPFWTLVIFGYGVARMAPVAVRASLLLAFVGLVVGAWWVLRTYSPQAFGPMAVLGLSYAMFRIVHLVVDSRDGELGTPLTWRSYLCYMTFFPNYLSGPVQRYQHFTPQVADPAPPLDAAGWGVVVRRAIAGIFKITLLAGVSEALHRMSLAAAHGQADVAQSSLLVAVAALAFAAWLYFAFAGYMDVASSVARALRVEISENFDHPLRSRNFLDVWSRWHITLSEWFKFYVFNPSLKAMLERTTRSELAPWLGAVAYFLAFFLMGIWHGRTPALIVYGLVLGAGVSLNKAWQVVMAQRLGRRGYAELGGRPGYQVFSQAAALGYFVLALGFLWLPVPGAPRVGVSILVGGALFVFAVCAVLAAGTRLVSTERAAPSGGEAWIVAALQLTAAVAYLWITAGDVPALLYIWL